MCSVASVCGHLSFDFAETSWPPLRPVDYSAGPFVLSGISYVVLWLSLQVESRVGLYP